MRTLYQIHKRIRKHLRAADALAPGGTLVIAGRSRKDDILEALIHDCINDPSITISRIATQGIHLCSASARDLGHDLLASALHNTSDTIDDCTYPFADLTDDEIDLLADLHDLPKPHRRTDAITAFLDTTQHKFPDTDTTLSRTARNLNTERNY